MTLKPVFKIFGYSFLFSLFLGTYFTYQSLARPIAPPAPPQKPQVLGMSSARANRPSQLQVYGGDYASASGGIISLSTHDSPEISLSSYNISGEAELTLYTANLDQLMQYLVHDEDGKQLHPSVDTSSLSQVATSKQVVSSDGSTQIALPLEGKGFWYIKIKLQNITVDGFIIRSDTGLVAKEGRDEYIIWGQDFGSRRSISAGELTLYGLKNSVAKLSTAQFDSSGIAKPKVREDADLAIYKQGDDYALLPLNLQHLNLGGGYLPFTKAVTSSRYFIFTDRPLYQPGDTVQFKAIIRQDDDAHYSVSSGTAKVTIKSASDDTTPVFEESYPISKEGAIDGSFKLKSDARIGDYTLTIDLGGPKSKYAYGEYSANNLYFQVQNYQKPESFISVDSSKLEYISGEQADIKLSGTYFSGQPLIDTKIKYKVTAVDYYEYSYYTDQVQNRSQSIDNFYGQWYGSQVVSEGEVTLNDKGEAVVSLDTRQLENPTDTYNYTKGQSKIFAIEATEVDGSLTPSFSRKNILVYAGEYGIYQDSRQYQAQVNEKTDLRFKLAPYFQPVGLDARSLTVKLSRETWVKKSDSSQKYPFYDHVVDDLGESTITTTKDGTASYHFTGTSPGYYKISVSSKDSSDNYIVKNFALYVTKDDEPIYSSEDSPRLSLSLDQEKYLPTDKVKATLTSDIAGRDVFISLERGVSSRYQVEHLSGKTKVLDLDLSAQDMPNIYLTAASFNDYSLDSAEVNIPVSPIEKKIIVSIQPDSKKYGPGSSIGVDLTTTDVSGNPVSAEVALWTVDKAIFELADSSLGNIFDNYWAQRGDGASETHSLMGILALQAEGGGGCFAPDTAVLLPRGRTSPISQIKSGDTIITLDDSGTRQVEARVKSVHKAQVDGYLIINDTLRLTPEHILRVGGTWRSAGSIVVGDTLTSQSGTPVQVDSVAWQQGKFEVYNLEVEKYHTFIAGSYWVHNQKSVTREVFKDTAYWNPRIQTGKDGKASVKFKLPDNLTTWTLSAVATTQDTQVGQATTEIMVAKDIVVRPITPNIMRVGDQVYLSALVQNFTASEHKFEVQLAFDSGVVAQNTWQDVVIPSMSMEQLTWHLTPQQITDSAKIKISAKTEVASLNDSIEFAVPIRQFGYLDTQSSSGIGDQIYSLDLQSPLDKDKSFVKLSLSPSVFGSLGSVLSYLLDYSFGCVEQTVSKMVAALSIVEHKELLASMLDTDKSATRIVDQAIARLSSMQRGDGGWTWWYTGKSDPFITSYVLENLTASKKLGHEVSRQNLERATGYLNNIYSSHSGKILTPEQISSAYGLVMAGAADKLAPISSLPTDPDLLAMSVIINYKLGDHNPSSNGLDKLLSSSQSQGDAIFWAAGAKSRFGSVSASTGLALKAMILAQADSDQIAQAALYLTRSRHTDYWDNTYGSSRAVSSLIDYSLSTSDAAPSYAYEVDLAGKKLASGEVKSAKAQIKDLDLPLSKLGSSPDKLIIKKSGEGNLYSTFKLSQFLTSTDIAPASHGLTITKRFENVKGADYAIGVGDSVNVLLTVSGLSTDDKYAVIVDELPSGMVPVNTALKNEQNSWNYPENFESSFDITDTEVTQNGVVLSLYNIPRDEHTYSYKARVVSAGDYAVPPATIALMYAPEIYGHTASSRLVLSPNIGTNGKLASKFVWPTKLIITIASVVVLIALSTIIYLKIKRKNTKQNDVPPVIQTPNEV